MLSLFFAPGADYLINLEFSFTWQLAQNTRLSVTKQSTVEMLDCNRCESEPRRNRLFSALMRFVRFEMMLARWKFVSCPNNSYLLLPREKWRVYAKGSRINWLFQKYVFKPLFPITCWKWTKHPPQENSIRFFQNYQLRWIHTTATMFNIVKSGCFGLFSQRIVNLLHCFLCHSF